jgi:hypothetical protein
VVDDRGYNDYALFAPLSEQGIYFVTRMKDNAIFEVIEEHPLSQNRNTLKDQTLRLTGLSAQEKCPHFLRRVEIWDPTEPRLGLSQQSLRAWGLHHRGDLQRWLAGGALLQGAKIERQDLHWHLRQRGQDSGVDRTDRHPDPVLPATQIVAFQSRRVPADESLGLAR